MADPYQILGVSPDASDEEIKRAYRKLAKKYHPDANPGDEYAAKKMQEINDAYDRIKNPEKNQGPVRVVRVTIPTARATAATMATVPLAAGITSSVRATTRSTTILICRRPTITSSTAAIGRH